MKAHIDKIFDYIKENGASKTSDISEYIGLSKERTRELLRQMKEVEIVGANRNRRYKIKEDDN